MEISNISNREFKIMIIKTFAEVRRAMHVQNKNFNKEIGNIFKIYIYI